MPHDKTITTDIASTGEANLFVEPSASLGGVRERPPTARPSGGKRIVRLDSSPVDSPAARLSARAHAFDRQARLLLRAVEARALGPLALMATLLVSLLALSALVITLRAQATARVAVGHSPAHAQTGPGITLRQVARLKAEASAADEARKRALADVVRWRSRARAAERHGTGRRGKHR